MVFTKWLTDAHRARVLHDLALTGKSTNPAHSLKKLLQFERMAFNNLSNYVTRYASGM
jgi:hypothetical protein